MRSLLILALLFPATVFAQQTGVSGTTGDGANPLLAAANATRPGNLLHSGLLAEPGAGGAMALIAPSPKLEPHPFFDRGNVIGMAIHAAIRGADTAQTCTFMSRTTKEAWLPMKSCSGIAAYSLSMIPAQIATSYLLHRRGYRRLERMNPYLWAVPSAAGIAVSSRAW